MSEATNLALQASRIDPSKLMTVLEGCDPESIPALPRSARAEFNIPEDAFVVGDGRIHWLNLIKTSS